MRPRHTPQLTALAFALLAAGCSREPQLIAVTGTVNIDGKPTGGVHVSFWPVASTANTFAARNAAGVTGPDGRFELKSVAGKGLEAGDYKVTFSRMVVGGKVMTGQGKKPDQIGARQSLPERYTDREKTDASARVAKDSNDFVFNLSSTPK